MQQHHIPSAILTRSQLVYAYLCEHETATAPELKKHTKLQNVADAVNRLNDGLLTRHRLPKIKRSRDANGNAVYWIEAQR